MIRLFSQKMKVFILLAALLLPTASMAGDRVPVCVSILPQKYFLEQIGGDHVEVSVMVQPGSNPETYTPKPDQMAALSKTSIYFTIGVPFETVWLKKITAINPAMLVVHTGKGIEKKAMERHTHNEGEKDPVKSGQAQEPLKGSHLIKDPHIWLSPPLVMIQARNILQALVDVDPGRAPFYQSNYMNFIIDIVKLDTEIQKTLIAKDHGFSFMVFHPAWGYFAEAYGLKQIPIELEGKEPKPAHLQYLISHAREQKVKVIFVQPQFSSKSAEVIARAIGARVAHADPLHPDWAGNLRQQAANFKDALR
jgi:zinc transport system substrate-binding protein